MSLIRHTMLPVLVSLTAVACGGQRTDTRPPICSQPTELTAAELGSRDASVAEVRRLEQERDSARQWASEEARRQSDGQRHRQYRRDLQTSEWAKLDEVDEQLHELRHRLDLWAIPDRKGAYKTLLEGEQERTKIDGEIRRIATEPDSLMPQLRDQVDTELESTTESLRQVLQGKREK